MQAVILAGGRGIRLHPLMTNVPKPLVPLFDSPVMEHSVRLLARHGIKDIFVTLSHLAKDVIDYFGDGSRWGVRIRYCVEDEPMGTAGGVKLLQNMIEDTFVVVSGDVVTDLDLSAALDAHKSNSAMASILLHAAADPGEFGIVATDSFSKVTRFIEKPRSSEIFGDTVNTGIYILEPEALSSIPYHQPFDFSMGLFPLMLNNREPVYGFSLPGYWCDVGNLLQYRGAHFDALEGRLKVDIPAAHIGDGIWLGERVTVHPSARVSPPIYLGDGVTVLRDASIGPRTVIGAECVIDQSANISHSVIGSRSYVGQDACVTNCIIGSEYGIAVGEVVSDQTAVSHARYRVPAKEAAPVDYAPAREELALRRE